MDLVSSPEHTKVVVLTDHVDKVSYRRSGRYKVRLDVTLLILLLCCRLSERSFQDRPEDQAAAHWCPMCVEDHYRHCRLRCGQDIC